MPLNDYLDDFWDLRQREKTEGCRQASAIHALFSVPVEPFRLAWKPSFLDQLEIVGLKVMKEEAGWQQLSRCQLQILLFSIILLIRC